MVQSGAPHTKLKSNKSKHRHAFSHVRFKGGSLQNGKHTLKVYMDEWTFLELVERAKKDDVSISHQISMDVEQANVEDRRRNVRNRK